MSYWSGRYCINTFCISHLRWERVNFYHRPSKTRGHTHASPPTENTKVFLRWEKFLPERVVELSKQQLAYSVPRRCIDSEESQTLSPQHSVWGVPLGWQRYDSVNIPTRPHTNIEADIKCLEEVVLFRINRVAAVWQLSLHHATQAEEHRLDNQKMSVLISPQTFGCLTL